MGLTTIACIERIGNALRKTFQSIFKAIKTIKHYSENGFISIEQSTGMRFYLHSAFLAIIVK